MTGDVSAKAIRHAVDADGDAWGWLAARCWADYPGSVFDRHGELRDLDQVASYYTAKGGQTWSAILDDRIVGTLAVAPSEAGGNVWEVSKVYVDPNIRRRSIATELMAVAEAFVVERGGDQMILWTDTRFTGAHRFYERKGYVADGRTRDLYDLSNSVEFFYRKRLAG
ncbi:MAG: GNAT family N-acetyltransferase [Alphaproteobacteria bacterium]|jgi:putative acetyltransferase